jgi:hypothetical protein
MGKSAQWLATYTTKNYGVPLCAACAHKRKEATDAPTETPAPVENTEEEGGLL